MNWKVLLAALGILAFTPCAVMWAIADDDVEDIEDEEDEDYEDEDDEEDIPTAEGRVVARMTCDDIKVKISELRAQVNANPDLQEELDNLLKKQRGQCARSSRARPVRNLNNAMPQIEEPIEEEVVEEEVVEKPKKKKKKKQKAVTEDVVEVVEEAPVSAEQKQKEMEIKRAESATKGLCPGDVNPNKFGCCDGEKFKDLGNLKFACCLKDDESKCYQPIKK